MIIDNRKTVESAIRRIDRALEKVNQCSTPHAGIKRDLRIARLYLQSPSFLNFQQKVECFTEPVSD